MQHQALEKETEAVYFEDLLQSLLNNKLINEIIGFKCL